MAAAALAGARTAGGEDAIADAAGGIDLGSKAYFHILIHDLARQGTAVLLISSDMPELITLADRILVMNRYRIEEEMVEPCLRALERSDPDIFLAAGRYTLLDTASLDTLLPRCQERGVSVVMGGPYNSGLPTGGTLYDDAPAPSPLIARRDAIAALCDLHGVDLRAASLQFCTAHPAVAAAIPGARTVEEMRQDAALMTQPIPPALWAEMKRDGLIPRHAPLPAWSARWCAVQGPCTV